MYYNFPEKKLVPELNDQPTYNYTLCMKYVHKSTLNMVIV